MQLNEGALKEFVQLYEAEFGEDIPKGEAEIIANNLAGC